MHPCRFTENLTGGTLPNCKTFGKSGWFHPFWHNCLTHLFRDIGGTKNARYIGPNQKKTSILWFKIGPKVSPETQRNQPINQPRFFKPWVDSLTLWGKSFSAPHQQIPSLKLTSHLKMDGWNTTFLWGRPIFRGYVSFREGSQFISYPIFVADLLLGYLYLSDLPIFPWFMFTQWWEAEIATNIVLSPHHQPCRLIRQTRPLLQEVHELVELGSCLKSFPTTSAWLGWVVTNTTYCSKRAIGQNNNNCTTLGWLETWV